MSDRIDRLSPWRNAAQIVLDGITGLLTVLAFLYKAERGHEPRMPGRRVANRGGARTGQSAGGKGA